MLIIFLGKIPASIFGFCCSCRVERENTSYTHSTSLLLGVQLYTRTNVMNCSGVRRDFPRCKQLIRPAVAIPLSLQNDEPGYKRERMNDMLPGLEPLSKGSLPLSP